MSNRQHPDARLFGYKGPYFPPELYILDWGAIYLVGEELRVEIPSFLFSTHMTTSDGYEGFTFYIFTHGENNEILVAGPNAEDTREEDGSPTDRSPAVYIKGDVPMQEVQTLLRKLDEMFQ